MGHTTLSMVLKIFQRMVVMVRNGFIIVVGFALFLQAQQTVRIKDVASLTGLEELQLYGYGLVVGLGGTGDRTQTIFTEQTIGNMLKNMGIELPDGHMRVRNVAAVMVTGTLKPFSCPPAWLRLMKSSRY